MKLTVKTLKGSHFEIRVLPTDTIMAVKKNIEDSQSKDNYPCGQQLLIHNGKVLKDETTLVENKVTEEGFLVVMLSKSKTASSAGPSSTQPTSTTTSTISSTTVIFLHCLGIVQSTFCFLGSFNTSFYQSTSLQLRRQPSLLLCRLQILLPFKNNQRHKVTPMVKLLQL
jgi:hypothetical protein